MVESGIKWNEVVKNPCFSISNHVSVADHLNAISIKQCMDEENRDGQTLGQGD